MTISRRSLIGGALGAAALTALPELQAMAAGPVLSNQVAAGPIPQGGINGSTETHALALVDLGARGMCLAVCGSFSSLLLPNGQTVAASNAAVVRLSDHKVMWAARQTNGYVSRVTVANGVVYWGGKFTTFGGQARDRLAAIDTTTWGLLPWNPKLNSGTAALAASGSTIIVGGNHVWGVEDARGGKTGRMLWRSWAHKGPCHSLLVTGGSLYAGGAWQNIANYPEMLVKMNPATGVIDKRFNPPFKPYTDGFRGDAIMSLTAYPSGRILVGSGGFGRNGIWILNAATGAVSVDPLWAYTAKTITPGISSVPPNQAEMKRNSEGDVQAVAVIGGYIVHGQHRGQLRYNKDWETKRNLTAWYQSNGRVVPWFDLGLWGSSADNGSGMNGGVQALLYAPAQKLLIVGSCCEGWGDPYNNTGGSDLYGTQPRDANGQLIANRRRPALVYVKIV